MVFLDPGFESYEQALRKPQGLYAKWKLCWKFVRNCFKLAAVLAALSSKTF